MRVSIKPSINTIVHGVRRLAASMSPAAAGGHQIKPGIADATGRVGPANARMSLLHAGAEVTTPDSETRVMNLALPESLAVGV